MLLLICLLLCQPASQSVRVCLLPLWLSSFHPTKLSNKPCCFNFTRMFIQSIAVVIITRYTANITPVYNCTCITLRIKPQTKHSHYPSYIILILKHIPTLIYFLLLSAKLQNQWRPLMSSVPVNSLFSSFSDKHIIV